jgi:outer membrane cobalamin receptor
VLATLVALGSTVAHGQPDPKTGLYGADVVPPRLSELSSDVVYTVSKRLQFTQEAPAIVRVFTREEILRRGFRNLNELLASIPEVELMDTGRYQHLLIKGAPFTILALLDGVSLVNHFDNTVDLERLVPLEIVRKVEVVLSPGGVLWGAHSVYGVVNIITKQASEERQQRVSVSGGSWRTLRAAYSLASTWSDLLWQAHVSVESYRGETVEVGDSPLAPPSHFESGAETENDTGIALNAFGALRWRGWFARALALVLDEHPYAIHEGTGARARRGENGVIQIPTLSAAAGYERALQWRRLALRLGGQAYVYHQAYHDRSWPYPKSALLPEGTSLVDRIERQLRVGTLVDAQATYGPSTTTLGVDVFRSSSSVRDTFQRNFLGNETNFVALPAVSSFTGSIYAQEELQLHRDINLAAGARVNLSDSYSTALLLHGHAVYEPIDGFWLKANYSEGFRPPSFEQRFWDLPFNKGDDSLKPEQSRVVELQASYRADLGSRLGLELTAGYTYARFTNLVAPVKDDLVWVFQNLGEEELHSVSLLGRAELKQIAAVGAYVAGHFPVAADGAEARQDFARLRLAADATLLLYEPFTVTVRYGFTGPRRVFDYFDPVQQTPAELDVGAYHDLSLAIRLRLYKLPLYLSGTLRNILCDEHSHIPPYTHQENIYRGLFPQPATTYGFLSVEWVHDL